MSGKKSAITETCDTGGSADDNIRKERTLAILTFLHDGSRG